VLVDALFLDGYRALGALHGLKLGPEVARAAKLLATVIGQDIEKPPTGGSSSPKGCRPTG
jgi:hypothetical protein